MLCLLVASSGCDPVPVVHQQPPVAVVQQQPPLPVIQQQPAVPIAPERPDVQPAPERPAVEPAQVDERETEKQETRNFIVDKCKDMGCDIREAGGGMRVTCRREASLSFKKDGILVINEKHVYFSGLNNGKTFYQVYEIVLKDMNPRRVTLERYPGIDQYSEIMDFLEMYTTGEKDRIKWTQPDGPNIEDPHPFMRHDIYFLLNQNERTRRQLVKAFTHLIELEGGKPDPFED